MLKPWIERKFELGLPDWKAPFLIERFSGTPARLTEKITSADAKLDNRPASDKWSILEHAGHLIKVEQLWRVRFKEFAEGLKELTAAEMSGKSTWEANFNETSPEIILSEFKKSRAELTAFLASAPSDYFLKIAFHPRLKKDMTPVDLLYFACEHDDFHLAVITNLMK